MRPSSLPPGPRAPRAWQTLRYLTRPLELFEECHERYGDLFTLKLVGSGTWVFVAAPDLARQLFTAPPDVFEAGSLNRSVWGVIAGNQTLFTLDNSAHLKRRRLLLPPFHGERLKGYVEDMRDVTEEVISSWPADREFAIQKQMQTITLRVLLRAGFGLRSQHSDGELMRLLVRVADEAMSSALLLIPALQRDWGARSPWGRILRLIQRLDAVLLTEIRRRRRAGRGGRDVLGFLLEARDEAGTPLPDTDIRDELVTMLMAGHDTTEIELTWAFGLILSHPKVIDRIREEVQRITGGDPVESGTLPQLEYLDAVIRECMRLRPIAPHVAFRRVTRPYDFRGFRLPAGTIVSNAVHLLQRRPDVYANPLEFRPERFLGKKVDPYAWAPFGGGSRRCIGMSFALWEMKVVLATVLRNVNLTLGEPSGATTRSGFFVVAKRGLPVRLDGWVCDAVTRVA